MLSMKGDEEIEYALNHKYPSAILLASLETKQFDLQIKSMKEMYFLELNEVYIKIAMNVQHVILSINLDFLQLQHF